MNSNDTKKATRSGVAKSLACRSSQNEEGVSSSTINIHQSGELVNKKSELGVKYLHFPEGVDVGTNTLADKVTHLVHTLRSKVYTRPTDEGEDHTRFFTLHSDLLRNVYGGNYSKVVKYALDHQLIEQRSSYSAGWYAKQYRIHPQLWEEKWKWKEVKSTRFQNTLRRVRREVVQGIKDPVDRHMYACLEQLQLDPSIETYLDRFNQMYDIPAIECIASRSWRYEVDRFGYRRHHNVTNLISMARMFLRLEGRPLFEVDLPNSHPLMTGIITRHWENYTRNRTKEEGGIKEEEKKLYVAQFSPSPYAACTYDDIFTLSERNDILHSIPDDLNDYLSLCESGELYEHIGKLANQNKDRSTLKRGILTMLHDNNYRHWGNPYWRVFREHFPTIANMMLCIKAYPTITTINIKKNQKDKPQPHRDFSALVQRVESHFMYHKVAPAILAIDPKCWFISIHDSFLTTEDNIPLIKHAISEQLELIGINASPKVKPCNEKETYYGKLEEWMGQGLSFWEAVAMKTHSFCER